jgi:hypothetical protein
MVINVSEVPIPLECSDTIVGIRALRCGACISTNRPTLMTLMMPQKFCRPYILCPISLADSLPHTKVPVITDFSRSASHSCSLPLDHV